MPRFMAPAALLLSLSTSGVSWGQGVPVGPGAGEPAPSAAPPAPAPPESPPAGTLEPPLPAPPSAPVPNAAAPNAPPAYVAPAYVYPPPPGMYVAVPPAPAPPPEPGRHLHDGFYLRMSLGAGWLRTRVESNAAGVADTRVSGAGGGVDILLGGTPGSGLVLGGGVFVLGASDPRLESGGSNRDISGDASLSVLGPFVDWFFDPEAGLHAGLGIGLSTFTLKSDDTDENIDDKPFNGAGGSVFFGYDAWIGSDWSLGGYVRAAAASGKRELDSGTDTTTERASSFGFSILFSALYH